MNIQSVQFRRKKNSAVERGIMIDEDKLIIDENCKVVKNPLYDYRLQPWHLCVNIELKGN